MARLTNEILGQRHVRMQLRLYHGGSWDVRTERASRSKESLSNTSTSCETSPLVAVQEPVLGKGTLPSQTGRMEHVSVTHAHWQR